MVQLYPLPSMGRKNSTITSSSVHIVSCPSLRICCELPPFFSASAMSPPTKQFHRLSIGQDMQEARAQSSRTARTGRRDPSDDDESREEEDDTSAESEGDSDDASGEDEEDSSDDDESTSSSTVLARSGITYDLSKLDTDSEAKALVGLTGKFDVLNCQASGSGYDFQLLDRPRVHISDETSTCTCSTFQAQPGTACQHIFVSGPIS